MARYVGPDGRQRSKTFARKTDARAFLAAMQTDKDRGTWIDPKGAVVPFGRWMEEWFDSQHGLGPSAKVRDGILIRRHILPFFGMTPLGRISALDTRAFVNHLVSTENPQTGKPLSPATVRLIYRLFSAAMRAAVAAKLIGDAPLGRGIVVLPQNTERRARFLSETEFDRLAGEIPEEFRTLVFTAAYSGCRWQEVGGLKRVFLDLPKGVLHVRFVLETVNGSVSLKPTPKSEAGWRSVSLPRFLVQMLGSHLEAGDLDEMVFAAPKGGLLHAGNFRKRVWLPAVERARLKPLRFHDLRHSHAAWLIRDGVQPLALMRRLGHEDIRTTMMTYGHLFPNHEEDIVETLHRRWEGAREENAKIISLRKVDNP